MPTRQKLVLDSRKQTYISLFSFAFDEDVPAIRKQTFLGKKTDAVLGVKIVEECFKGNAMCEQILRKKRPAILICSVVKAKERKAWDECVEFPLTVCDL